MDCRRTIFAALLVALLPLAGCVLSGGGMEETVDRSAVTNAIAKPGAPAPLSAAPDQVSDGRTVRNAVSSADLSAAAAQPTPWANAETGASGTITAIREVREGDTICRRFKTSRQRFDGVALYDGEACLRGQGEWTLTRFAEGG